MIEVGITGGIGAGKTLVCQIFKTLGIPVYNSDTRGRYLTNINTQIVEKIKVLFGDNIYLNDELDRKKVAAIVFNNSEKLQELNAIIHPVVAQDYTLWKEHNKTRKIIIKESALLFETGIYKSLNKIILVTAPLPLRKKRVLKRDNISEQEFNDRAKKQMPKKDKIALADYIINNDEQQLLTPQVLAVFNSLTT